MSEANCIYIAGPMRGIPYYNFPAFDEAAERFWAQGWWVCNPADMDRAAGFDPAGLPPDTDWHAIPAGFDFAAAVQRDIAGVQGSDAIYMLRGWEKSTGARAEHALAVWLGKKIIMQPPGDVVATPADGGEVRAVDPTSGAEKGTKLARFDLIPTRPLWLLAEHYGRGARKYADRNWERGYAWSLSYAAAMRHMAQFWAGEDIDAESGSPHVIAAAWHCLSLAEYMSTNRERDDRPKGGRIGQ